MLKIIQFLGMEHKGFLCRILSDFLSVSKSFPKTVFEKKNLMWNKSFPDKCKVKLFKDSSSGRKKVTETQKWKKRNEKSLKERININ